MNLSTSIQLTKLLAQLNALISLNLKENLIYLVKGFKEKGKFKEESRVRVFQFEILRIIGNRVRLDYSN